MPFIQDIFIDETEKNELDLHHEDYFCILMPCLKGIILNIDICE